MKKFLALAIAAAMASPVALGAEHTVDNVGDVTYAGNIVANSPMWQWTVNDYPGGRLDAKPSESITEDGITTYPLVGQAFIAVSGYLPAFTSVKTPIPGKIGMQDKTALYGADGAQVLDTDNNDELHTVSFTIPATGTTAGGASVTGTLQLTSTELRGYRVADIAEDSGRPELSRVQFRLLQTPSGKGVVQDGSCFAGTPAGITINGTPHNFTLVGTSPTSEAAFISALGQADTQGNAPQFIEFAEGAQSVAVSTTGCENATTYGWSLTNKPEAASLIAYYSAAHVLELTPSQLAFSTPIVGTWSSVLTVTAYQM